MSVSVSASVFGSAEESIHVSHIYGWAEISKRLRLDLKDAKFSSCFLKNWVFFRDNFPLERRKDSAPSKPFDTRRIRPLYDMMHSAASSPYDGTTNAERWNWTADQYEECLVYRCARNLAVEGQPLWAAFRGRYPVSSMSDQEAALHPPFQALTGLFMIARNLVADYQSSKPSQIVRSIEAVCPASNPQFSPIFSVRQNQKKVLIELDIMRYELKKLSITDLKTQILNSLGPLTEREDEKTLLIEHLLRVEENRRQIQSRTGASWNSYEEDLTSAEQ